MNNNGRFNLGRTIVILIMLTFVIVGGTFAWFNFSSKQSALVLTVGDINDTQIKLSPYQIKGTMTPVNTYTSGVYSEVEVVNGGDKSTSVTLFYKVNELDQELIDNGLKYTITSSSSANGTYSEVKTGDFTDYSSTDEEAILLDTNTSKNSTVYYRVYLWLDSSEGNQSEVQNATVDVELNGSIGSVTISGENTYGHVLTANVTDSSKTATYNYQWFSNTTNSTSGGTALTSATTSNTYTVGSGLAGKYIYVVATVIEDYYDDRVYTDVTDSENNTTATVDREDATMTVTPTTVNLTYPNTGTFTYTYTGDGEITCSSSNTSVATCTVDTTNKKVTVTPKSAPNNAIITLTAAQGTNYKTISKTVNVSVAKGNMSAGVVTISGTNRYDSTLTATVNPDTSPKADTYKYQWYYNSTNSTSGGTAISGATSSTYKVGSGLVGKYIYVVVTAEKQYYNSITFNDITDSVVSPITGVITLSAKTATYTGSAIAANTATTNSSGTVVYAYYSNNTCTTKVATSTGASATGAAPVDAGNYYSQASVTTANGDYTAATSDCVAHTIDKKSVAISWGSTTAFTYSGSAQAPTVSATTNITGETMTVTRTTQTNAGNYTSTASCSSVSGGRGKCSNYSLTSTTKDYSIAKYTPSISLNPTSGSVAANSTNTFKATPTTITACKGTLAATSANTSYVTITGGASTSNVASGTAVTITYKGVSYTTGTNITVSYTPTDTANCNSASSKTYSASVTRLTPTISLTEKSTTYTGSAIAANAASATYNSSNVSLSYTYTYYTNNTCTTKTTTSTGASSEGGAPIDAGTYYVKAVSTQTGVYNSASSACTKHTITAKSVAVTWGSTTAFTYNGSAQGPSASVSSTGITGETMTVTRTTQTNVGSYTSTASCSSVSGGRKKCSNYSLTSTTKDYSIAKYTPTLAISATSGSVAALSTKTFTATPTTISACLGTLKATSANTSYVTITGGASTSNAASGTAVTITYKGVSYTTGTNITVSYTPTDTANCNSASSKTYSASVTRLTPTVTLTAKSAAYTGSAIAANAASATYNGSNVNLSYTYTYYNGESCSGTALSGAPTNAGNYSVKATSTQTGVYNSASSACVAHTINKYTPSIALSATSGSVAANSTNTFTATPTTISNCQGTLTATSANTSYVTITGGASNSNVASGTAKTITYKGISYTTGTNITVAYAPTDTSNCNSATSKTFSASVTRVTPTVSLTAKSATYSGSAIAANAATATYNSSAVTLSYTYTYYTNNTCTTKTTTATGASASGGAPVNAGTYYVKATSTQTGVYNSASSSCVAHTISKYTPSIALSATSGSVAANSTNTFTATPTTISACQGTLTATSANTSYVTITGGASNSNVASGTAKTITYKGISYTTGTNITVAYAPTDTSNCNSATSKTFSASVTRVTPTVSLTAKTATYSGSAIAANAATATYNSSAVTLSYTYTYYTNSTCTTKTTTSTGASASGGAPVNVGTYYVKATSTQTGAYNSASSSCVAHTISKYTPSIALSATSGSVAANSTNTFTATPTTIASCQGTLTATSANTSYVTITGGASNSNVASGTAKTITYKGISYTTGTNITVSYTPTDTANCNSASSKTFAASVTRVTPTISLTAKSATYSGSAIAANAATATYNSSAVTLSYAYTYYTNNTCTTKTTTATGASASGGAPVNAGTYYVKATSTQTGVYASASSSCVAHTINKYTPSIALSATSGSVAANSTNTFTATPTTISNCQGTLTATSANTSYVTITGGASNSNVASGTAKTITYKGISYTTGTNITVAYAPTDTTNCNSASSKTFSASVTRVTPTISLTAKSATYSGSAIAANAATATYNSSAVTLSYTYTYYTNNTCTTKTTTATGASASGGAPVNAGTYYVKATSTQTGAYNSASSSCVAHTINKANLSGSVKITGKNTEDETLTASVTNTNSASLTYQWWTSTSSTATSGTAISGATSSTYKLTSAQVGKYVGVTVSATKTNYNNASWNDITDATNNTTAKVQEAVSCNAPTSVTVSGTAQVNQTLTASVTNTDNYTLTYKWWYTTNSTATIGTVISGATSSTYTVASNNQRYYVGVTVTATKTGCTSVTLNDKTNTTIAAAPSSTSCNAPTSVTITGTNQVNQTLTASVTNTDNYSLSYQWGTYTTSWGSSSCSAISGATSSTYKLTTSQQGKTMCVKVTATKTGCSNASLEDQTDKTNNGSATVSAASSSSSSSSCNAPTAVTVSGTAQVNSTLTASVTNNTGGYTLAYQWWRTTSSTATTGTNISGATSSTYTVSSSYRNYYIGVTVTATKTGCSTVTLNGKTSSKVTDASSSSSSSSSSIVVNVTITGTNKVDQTLTASVTTNPSNATLKYQWWYSSSSIATSGTNISGATSSTYKVASTYVGKYIGVTVTATKTGYTQGTGYDKTDTSNGSATVQNSTPSSSSSSCNAPTGVTVSGTSQVGQTLTASVTNTTGGYSLAYKWWTTTSSTATTGTAISGATSSTFTLTSTQQDKYVGVTVTATKSGCTTVTLNDKTDAKVSAVGGPYTVTFDACGGTGAPSSQSKTHGVDLTLSSTKPTREGYTFKGWALKTSTVNSCTAATSAIYQAGGKYTTNADATLYAVWQGNTITVSYNSNGGTGTMQNTTYTYGQSGSWNMRENTFTKSGYTYVGWHVYDTVTKKWFGCTDDSVGCSTSAGNTTLGWYSESQIKLYYTPSGTSWGMSTTLSPNNMTLYAVWEKNAVSIVSSYSCANKKVGSSPYAMTYTGNCTVIDDGGGNWRVKFLTTGTLKFTSATTVDAFLVGGGGGGSSGAGAYGGGGGGGGNVSTVTAKALTANTNYAITIGTGGTGGTGGANSCSKAGTAGGQTSAFSTTVNGGTAGSGKTAGTGGANGGAGAGHTGSSNGVTGGNNREFGNNYAMFYAAGGGGGGGINDVTADDGEVHRLSGLFGQGGVYGGGDGGPADAHGTQYTAGSGLANTGSGGGGGNGSYAGVCGHGGAGGSGVVIIRNNGWSGTYDVNVSIYTPGNQITSLTGGWKSVDDYTASSVTFGSSNIAFVTRAGGKAAIYTKNKIDITNYDYITFTYNITNASDWAGNNNVIFGLTSTNTSYEITSSNSSKFINRKNGGTVNIDISSVTGSYYIGFASNSNDITITYIRLLKKP